MYNHNKLCWDAIDEMGGDTSAPHNLQNLAEAILIIPTGPAVPKSLEELKQMVNRGREIVVGTEIPDTYGGQSNPLIVAQNLNSTNNSSYGGVEGVILVRKYVEPTSQVFSTSSSGVNYSNSSIKTFLNGTYLNNCSDTLKNLISNISVPYYNGTSVTTVSDKWFLMSDYEVCSNRSNYSANYPEGVMLQYWKDQTGLSSPSLNTTSGRIAKSRAGSATAFWLRSRFDSSSVCYITFLGGGATANPTLTGTGVLPACFIGKD